MGKMPGMKRREFLKTSAAVAGTAAVTNLFAAEKEPGKMRHVYELRKYHLRRGPMQKRFDDFYRDAAIPAMNRAGMNPIGVFSVATGPDIPTLYVLIPHESAGSMIDATDKLRADADYPL